METGAYHCCEVVGMESSMKLFNYGYLPLTRRALHLHTQHSLTHSHMYST